MRFGIVLFTVIASLTTVHNASAQSLTLSVKDAPLKDVFDLIESQSDVRFFYRIELLQKARALTFVADRDPLADVLQRCFQNQPLTYEIIDKVIVVKEKPPEEGNALKQSAAAPNVTVRGRVLTTEGEPVGGATVIVKGTSNAVASTASGTFAIKIDKSNAILEVTSVSTEPLDVAVGNKRELTVRVRTKISALDQVQIIGYGQTTKRLNTGNVITIKAVDIERQPVANVLGALQGYVAGMSINQNTGLPGSGFQAVVRGTGTLSAGTRPLFIVDGVPYPDFDFGANNFYKPGQNGLNLLNTGEIERVEILKDADATAIYGSRGGNGVVLITTKKGKPGVTSLDVNMYTGFGKVTVRPKLLNLQQWLELELEKRKNDNVAIEPGDFALDGPLDTSRYTDWSKELLGGTARITDARLALSGSSPAINYRVIGGYHRETTVMPVSGSDRRYLLHFHLAHAPADKKFRAELSGTYQAGVDDLPATDFARFLNGLYLHPNQPPSFLPDGQLNFPATQPFTNPYSEANKLYRKNMNNMAGNFKIFWLPVRGLELSASLGYTTQSMDDISSTRNQVQFATPMQSFFGSNTVKTYILEPQARYVRRIKGKGNVSLLLGTTYQKTTYAYLNLKATGFTSEALLGSPSAATSLTVFRERYINYKYLGTFSRLSLNWADKYLVNLTGRVDGVSRFAPDKQFHPFGAIGAAWILSEEGWMPKRDWINLVKVRGSYGLIGNSDIPDAAFLNTYASYLGAYQGVQGLTPNQLFDSNLGWELKKSGELAVELQMFKNRLGFSVSAYRNRNSEQLLKTVLPAITGFYDVFENHQAEVENKGLEVVLDGTPVTTRNFTWSVTANVTVQQNKLVRFEELESAYYTGLKNFLAIGKPVTSYRVYKYGGVDPQTGAYFFIDRKGNRTATPTDDDRTEYVNLAARSYGGLTNSFSYKQVSLDIHCVFVVRNNRAIRGIAPNLKEDLARWQKPGDVTHVPKLTRNPFSTGVGYYNLSTGAYGDASYVRVRNVSLSYNVSNGLLQRWHLQKLRFYLLAQNLFTITRVKNWDPETIMNNSIAPLRVLTGGFQISL